MIAKVGRYSDNGERKQKLIAQLYRMGCVGDGSGNELRDQVRTSVSLDVLLINADLEKFKLCLASASPAISTKLPMSGPANNRELYVNDVNCVRDIL